MLGIRGLGRYARNCTVRPRRRDAAYLQTQLLIAQKEEAKIQLQAEEYDLMSVAADIDEIEEVNANCILMANLQQASTSSIQTGKAPIYDSDGSAEVHCDNGYNNDDIFYMFTQEDQYYELREPIPESHLVQQNDSDVITAAPSVELSGGIVEQHFATVEEIHAYYQSLYKNLAVEVKKVNMVNRNMKVTNAELTTELARCSAKQTTTLNEEITNLNTQLSNEKSTISFLQEERKKLKSYFKKREDELLDKQILLENKIKGLENIRNRLGHNLFSVGQFCDSDLEVAFKRNTCFIRNLKGVYLLKGNQTSNLYTINLHDMAFASRIFLMARATSTKSRLWHQRLSYLNFDTINDLAKNDLVSGLPKFKYSKEHLCPSCEQGKSKRASHPPKPIPPSKSKDEAQEVIITFLKRITVLLQSLSLLVYNRRTKKIMETMNVTFDEHFVMAFEQRSSKARTLKHDFWTYQFKSRSYDVDEFSFHQHVQQQDNQAPLQSNTVADNLKTDGDMCIDALSVSTMEPSNVKEAMTDSGWIDSMQEELL
ncbi:retrovirus-related pol polyprotein from transposon TNT 1-94 [Tanacetum coccineum]